MARLPKDQRGALLPLTWDRRLREGRQSFSSLERDGRVRARTHDTGKQVDSRDADEK